MYLLLLDPAVHGLNLMTLFGNRYIVTRHRYPTHPGKAHALRGAYAHKYGPYGDNLIEEGRR